MVSKNRRLKAILDRVKDLEARVYIADDPAVTYVSFQADGTIIVDGQYLNLKNKLRKINHQVFKSGSDVLDYLDSITHNNPVIIDPFEVLPNGFYIDTSLLFCLSQEELAHLHALSESDTAYMGCYLDMVRKYAFDCELPKSSILSDLQGCCNELTVNQLVERYSDIRWFNAMPTEDDSLYETYES